MPRPRISAFLPILILLWAGFFLRLYRIDVQNIWWDEARNIDVASRPWLAIAGSPELDIHPPIYFYILHAWTGIFGYSEFAVRSLSAFFGLLSAPLLFVLGRRVGRRRPAIPDLRHLPTAKNTKSAKKLSIGDSFVFSLRSLRSLCSLRLGHMAGMHGYLLGVLALGVGALAPFFLAEAQETRMYTVTFVWLLAAAYCLLRAVAAVHESDTNTRMLRSPVSGLRSPAFFRAAGAPWWAGYTLLAAASLLTHYSAVFVLAPWQLWIALRALGMGWRDGRRLLGKAILAGLGMIFLFLPQVPIALRQIPTYRNLTLTIPGVGAYLLECGREYIVGPALSLAAAAPWLWGLAIAGTIGLGLFTWHGLHGKDRQSVWSLAFLLIWLAGGLVVYYITLLDRGTFHPRYISFVTPALYALIGAALAGWWQTWRPAGLIATLALALVVIPAVRADQFDPQFFSEDTAGLAAWLTETATPADLILIDVPYPLGLYYPRYARLGEPPSEPANLAPARYLFVDIHSAAPRLTELAAGRQRLFWVRWFKSDTDPRGVITFLLDKYAEHIGEKGFRGYAADIYRLPPTGQFELAPSLTPASVRLGPLELTGVAFGGRGGGPTSDLDAARGKSVPADKGAWAVLSWRRATTVDRPYKATLYLEDRFGQRVGQDDRTLLSDRHLTLPYWGDNEEALNVYSVPLTVGSPPGVYTLKAAVYDPATGQRVDRLDAAGAPQGTDVVLGTVDVVAPAVPPSVERMGSAPVEPVAWDGVTLLGADLPTAEVAPGTIVPLHLYWRADRAAAGREAVTIRLAMQGAGQEWSLRRTQPVDGAYPFAAWAPSEVVRDTHPWRLDPEMPAGDYAVEVTLEAGDGHALGTATLGTMRVAGRPRRFDLPPMEHAVHARLGDVAELMGYDLTEPEQAGGTLALTLYWRAIAPSAAPLTVFVHLLDGENKVRGQVDRAPGDGAYPTTGWVAEEVLVDAYQVPVDPDLRAGEYTVEVGMYDAATGARLPAWDANGQALGDRVLLEVNP